MSTEDLKKEIALELYAIGGVKFGEYIVTVALS